MNNSEERSNTATENCPQAEKKPLSPGVAATPFAFLGAVAVYFIYIYLFSFSPVSHIEAGVLGVFNQSAMVKYFFGLFLLAGAFLGLRMLLGRVLADGSERVFFSPLSHRVRCRVFLSLCVLLTAYLLVYVFYTESSGILFGADTDEFLWRTLPMPLTVGLTAAFTTWVLYDIYRGRDAATGFTYAVYFAAVLLVYFSFLYLHMTDVYHGIAYTESIYNASRGVPYTLITTGIYGHYGIFFGLILRIFGGNAVMMAHLIALSGALAAAACCYCAHCLTKRNALRVIGVLCAVFTTIVLREHNYWQLQPHRVLFPLLTVAYLCYMAKKNRYGIKHAVLGFVLTGVGIVWNTESGLFATAAFALGMIAHYWQTEKPFSRSMWVRYAALIGGAVGALAGAILLVNLYNLCCGGPFILKDFFFPVFEGSYMNGFLKVGPPYGVQVWMLTLILFFAVLLYGLWHTRALREGGEDPFAPVAVALAAAALMQYSYYANRAAYFNLDICCQLAALCMVLMADRFLDDWREIRTRALSLDRVCTAVLSLFCVAVMTVLAVQAPLAFGMMEKRAQNGQWDVAALNAEAAQLAELVPEDCLLIGLGSSTLNLQLGRDSKAYYRDISDLYIGGTVVEEQMAKDALAHGKVAFCLPDDIEREMVTNILAGGDFVLVQSGRVGSLGVEVYELRK